MTVTMTIDGPLDRQSHRCPVCERFVCLYQSACKDQQHREEVLYWRELAVKRELEE